MSIEEFVTEKGGFVNPEKIAAIDLYGFKKAKEMWRDDEPNQKTRNNLRIVACQNAINGRKALHELHFIH